MRRRRRWRRRRAAGALLLQPVRLQEQEQVRAEDTRRPQALGRFQVLLRDLRQEVQSEGRLDESHPLQPSGTAGNLRRLRQDLPQQQLPVRASEVRALQGQVRVPDLQEADGEPGESQRAHAQAARAPGERRVRGVRQDVLAEQQAEGAHEDSHRRQAVQLHRLQQVVRSQNRAEATPAHSHGYQAVRLRYLRQSLHAEAGPDQSQKVASGLPPAAAASTHRSHLERRYERLSQLAEVKFTFHCGRWIVM